MQTHLRIHQRELRKNMPQPEMRLWYFLRKKQLGVKFRRQYVIDNRILDFYCPELKLGIELDGDSHYVTEYAQKKDVKSDIILLKKGIKILRFLNTDVMKNIDGVGERILVEIEELKLRN